MAPYIEGYEPVDQGFVTGLPEIVAYHKVNIVFGAVCACLNIPLFVVFLTSPKLRRKHRNRILITLGVADTFNTLGIFFMGQNRVELYTNVITFLHIPVRTSWECALEPWLLLRGIGDVWPPVIQMVIGLERAAAVFAPIWFHKNARNRSTILILSTTIFVIIALSIGFLDAFFHRNDKVTYYCGRKAAFGRNYGAFLYIINIFGYLFSFIINVCTIAAAASTINKLVQRQVYKVRYNLIVSFLSFVLVSIPNAISLCSAWITEVADFIAKPSTYFTCVNSGINIFIYLLFNVEFREHAKSLFISSPPTAVSTVLPRMSTRIALPTVIS